MVSERLQESGKQDVKDLRSCKSLQEFGKKRVLHGKSSFTEQNYSMSTAAKPTTKAVMPSGAIEACLNPALVVVWLWMAAVAALAVLMLDTALVGIEVKVDATVTLTGTLAVTGTVVTTLPEVTTLAVVKTLSLVTTPVDTTGVALVEPVALAKTVKTDSVVWPEALPVTMVTGTVERKGMGVPLEETVYDA